MSTKAELLARRDAVMPVGVPRISELTIESAHGSTLVDVDGREYLDFASGIGVMSVGHGRREIVDAVKAQVDRLQHVCIHVATYEPYLELCEKLAQLFPHGDTTKVMLINSGSEAVENAIKIARQATRRSAVIAFEDAFHGRTMMSMTLTSKTANKIGCGPYAPEVYRLPFPDRFHAGRGLDEGELVTQELARLRRAFAKTVPGEQVAAVIIEVVQGEGGFNVAPEAYLRGLREVCDENGTMLIFDEVQSGFCRTGRWAAYQHAGVTPDLSTWAKAMGGGLPISAVIGRADVIDAARPGTIGSTFGGNPISCAAALAAIGIMEREDLCTRAAAIGDRIRARLGELRGEGSLVVDVRGMGAMMAMELCVDGDPARPAADEVATILLAARAEGVLAIKAGPAANVIRLLPPLCMTDEELDRGLDVLCRAVASCNSPAAVS